MNSILTLLSRAFRPLLAVSLVFHLAGIDGVQAQDGESLFRANCASCHRPTTEKMTGPGLKGARERVPGGDWIYRWVKNSQKLVKAGDPYAVKIFNEYKGSVMSAQAVTNEEIDAILDYVDSYVPPVKEKKTDNDDEVAGGGSGVDPMPWLLAVTSLLLIIVWVLFGVRKSLRQAVAERDGQDAPAELSLAEGLKLWASKNGKVVALLVIAVLGFLGVKGYEALMDVGVYEGYAPEQPINFPHDKHAGENGIACVYCHSSAEQGKSAGIPSVNVCMNCHRSIKGEGEAAQTEIAKIYHAAGWDPEEQAYTGEEHPIQWVRIHNLADFVYFNHSQHVVVGKQECQTCHGPVEEMEVMRQHSPLTMGWCINCHRETNVSLAGNGYYEDMHDDLKEKTKRLGVDQFTVEHIGGLECGKCHY